MERFVKGDIVVLPFPFSDLSSSKRRPAYVAASANNCIILCQITSSIKIDEYSVPLSNPDFSSGQINVASLVKPHRIFTADPGIVIRKIGKLKSGKIKEIEMSIVKIFES